MKISCLKAVANFFYASHKLLFMYVSSYAVIFQSSNFNVPNFIVCILFLSYVLHYKSMKVYIYIINVSADFWFLIFSKKLFVHVTWTSKLLPFQKSGVKHGCISMNLVDGDIRRDLLWSTGNINLLFMTLLG